MTKNKNLCDSAPDDPFNREALCLEIYIYANEGLLCIILVSVVICEMSFDPLLTENVLPYCSPSNYFRFYIHFNGTKKK